MFPPKVEHELPANAPAHIRRIAAVTSPWWDRSIRLDQINVFDWTPYDRSKCTTGAGAGCADVWMIETCNPASYEWVSHDEITNPANGILDRLSTLDVFRLTYHDARIHGIKHVRRDDHAPTQDMKVGAIACMLIGAALPIAWTLGTIATRILS